MATIRKKTSGNYEVQIRLSGLKSICKTFPTKTLAKQFQRQVEGDTKLQQALGKHVIDKTTFKEVVDLYMEQYTGRDGSVSGRLNYWCNRFGTISITSIDEIMVDDGLIDLSATRTGSTVNRYKSTLSAIFIFFIQHSKYKRICKELGFSNPVRKETISTYAENPALAYPLSYRNLEEMAEERGYCVDHSTINRWVIKYSPELEHVFQQKKKPTGSRWRMDETYIKVKWPVEISLSGGRQGRKYH